MNIAEAFAGLLGIDPNAVSKTLIFVKASPFDSVWHIGDASAVSEPQPNKFNILTLHGFDVARAMTADSLKSIEIQEISGQPVGMCEHCADEFLLCFKAIQGRPTHKFENFYKVLDTSLKQGN